MKSRFEKLKYKVQDIDFKKPIEGQFPTYFEHPLYPGYPDKKALPKVFAYVVLLLDPNSDLQKEFETDLGKRKLAAAVEANFPKDKDGKLLPYYQGIVDFENEDAVKLMLHFLKLVNDNLYRELMTKQITLDRHVARQWKLVNEEDPDYAKMEKAERFRENQEAEIRKKLLIFRGDYEELEDAAKEMFITPENILDSIPEIKSDVEQNKRGYY